MIKLQLNLRKFNNYAFFCPVSRLHLTVSNPVGYSNEVTPAILKALKAETILDVDGVVDIETGTVKAGSKAKTAPTPAPVQEKTPTPEPVKEEPKAEPKQEEKPVDEKPAKRGKKAATAE